MMEMLVSEYTRKGFLDGRTVRYPTIIIRPGAPNRAVTGIFSSVIREPLNGVPITVDVDPSLGHACAGYDTVIRATVAIHELPLNAMPLNDRTIQLQGLRVTIDQLMLILQEIAKKEALTVPEIRIQIDPELSAMCGGMPAAAGGRASPRPTCCLQRWTLMAMV